MSKTKYFSYAVIATLGSFILNGCAAKAPVKTESALTGNSLRIHFDPKYEINVSFPKIETGYACLDADRHTTCVVNRTFTTNCSSNGESQCEIKGNVTVGSSGEHYIKTYQINKQLTNNGNKATLTYTPEKETYDKAEDLIFGDSFEKYLSMRSVDDYLGYQNVTIKINEEFVSKYNQESVFGNFARNKIIDTNDVRQVSNHFPLRIFLQDAEIATFVSTFAYRNGTMVKIDNINIHYRNKGFERDVDLIRNIVIDTIKKAVTE